MAEGYGISRELIEASEEALGGQGKVVKEEDQAPEVIMAELNQHGATRLRAAAT